MSRPPSPPTPTGGRRSNRMLPRSACCRSRPEPGSRGRSKRRPPLRKAPGARPPPARTPSSSRPRGPARPWLPSSGPSTGSPPAPRPTTRCTAAGSSTSPRSRPSPSTSSATSEHLSPASGRPPNASALELPDIRVAIRTGDTPTDERRQFARKPPDVLITTPESLFLLLTAQAREALRGVETVIIDEVHAVAGTKRGAHLALSLERLDALLERPARRIGLSATVRPVDEVARFLGGTRDVVVVQPPSAKTVELEVVVPVADLSELGTVHRRDQRVRRRRRTPHARSGRTSRSASPTWSRRTARPSSSRTHAAWPRSSARDSTRSMRSGAAASEARARSRARPTAQCGEPTSASGADHGAERGEPRSRLDPRPRPPRQREPRATRCSSRRS